MMPQPTEQELQIKILSCLHSIAPEVDPTTLDKNKSLRDQIDIDSLDFVRLVTRLQETMGVEIPESDYPKLTSLESCIGYFRDKI